MHEVHGAIAAHEVSEVHAVYGMHAVHGLHEAHVVVELRDSFAFLAVGMGNVAMSMHKRANTVVANISLVVEG